MNLIIILVLFLGVTLTKLSEVDENFQIPVWTRLKEYETRRSEEASGTYRIDEESGCTCKETNKWITCFGSGKCQKFPKNLNVTVDKMKIRTTYIQKIEKGDLDKLRHLSYLEIEANSYLKYVESGTFLGMENLQNLSISFNTKITALEIDTFDGLVNLEELILIKNGFLMLSSVTLALTPRYLPKLYKLKLNENNFPEILENDFLPLENSSLSQLGLVLCQIEYIHPRSLAPLKSLNILRLGENFFNSSIIADLISTSVMLNIPLVSLNLYSMGFKKNPPKDLMRAIANSKITVLNLSRNQFELLKNDSFPYLMPNIMQLDLRDILAVNITINTFKLLPNLRILLLSNNKLPTVPKGVLLPQLQYLDLSSNSNIFTPSYFSLEKNKFKNMSNLWGLNLSYNNIHVLTNYSFTGLSNLKSLGLKQGSIFYISDGTFAPLKKLIFLDLDNNPFPKSGNNLNKNIFIGLEKLKVLLLNDCLIGALKPDLFVYLKGLEHLSLSNNHIKTLPFQVLYPLKSLRRINLEQNLLTSWSSNLFSRTKRLAYLNLSQNKITNLTEAMIWDVADLLHLDLSKNPFSCNCDLYHSIYNHGSKREKLVPLLTKEASYCFYPPEYSNVTIVDYYQIAVNQQLCPYQWTSLEVIGTALIITIIFLGTVVSVMYRYRWYLRFWFFLAKLDLIRRGILAQKSKETTQKYEYDAFVSYSSEDREFVCRAVDMLENSEPRLKLCVYERDFEIGTIITESVLESVAKSRKTMLIVSNSYVKSQWCRWETHVVQNHRLFFENEYGDLVDDSIVIIKLGSVSGTNMTPMLKYLMKTRIYLHWEQDKKVFWDKLRRVLAPPSNSPKTIQEDVNA